MWHMFDMILALLDPRRLIIAGSVLLFVSAAVLNLLSLTLTEWTLAIVVAIATGRCFTFSLCLALTVSQAKHINTLKYTDV